MIDVWCIFKLSFRFTLAVRPVDYDDGTSAEGEDNSYLSTVNYTKLHMMESLRF